MITEQDLKEAIAECQGERNPNANTCIKLAAYLTIYEHLYPKDAITHEETKAPLKTANIDNKRDIVGDYGDNEFYNAIKGKNAADMWAVMNELMDTISVINPRLYDGVLHQIL